MHDLYTQYKPLSLSILTHFAGSLFELDIQCAIRSKMSDSQLALTRLLHKDACAICTNRVIFKVDMKTSKQKQYILRLGLGTRPRRLCSALDMT